MTKQEDKKFEHLDSGDLQITIKTQDTLFLPGTDGKNVTIGSFDQTTVQTVTKDNVKSLKAYVNTQKEATKAKIEQSEEELKRLEFIKEDMIDDKLLKEIQDRLDKNKPFKKAMKDLNNFVGQMMKKKQLKFQLVYMKDQLKSIEKDEVGVNGK